MRDLVEAHGGRVEVTSDGSGRGMAFSVTVPVLAACLFAHHLAELVAEG